MRRTHSLPLHTTLERNIAGFTLIELLTTMLVAGILASIAVPSYSSFIANQRSKTVATNLHTALSIARSEATKRNASVTLASKAGGWQNGWQIYPSAAPANILQDSNAAKGVSINSSGVNTVAYQSSGRVQGTAAVTFVITASAGGSTANRCVSVDLSGRPYAKAGTTC